jgi:hypothetical protein
MSNKTGLYVAAGVLAVFLLVGSLNTMPANAPLGIRNNNPGNLRPTSNPWQGETTVAGAPYCSFDSAADGLRAASMNLYSYGANDGVNTVTGVANRWAPSGDNNNPTDYANTLSSVSGFGLTDTIDLTDPATNQAVLTGIVQAENGLNNGNPWYSSGTIASAVAVAIAAQTATS